VVVEIQRIDYDYNFDRFLLYHNMAIAEMQRTSEEYKTDRVVLTVAFFTGRYVAKDRKGNIVTKDILIHHSNLFDLDKNEYDVFGHKLIFLNHNYIQDTTPQGYKDWLNLIKESIKSPKNPQVNFENAGVRKVTELIDYEQLSPEERTESKNRNAAESAKIIYVEEAKSRRDMEIAKNLINLGVDTNLIVQATGLTVEQIEQLRHATS